MVNVVGDMSEQVEDLHNFSRQAEAASNPKQPAISSSP